MIFSYFIFLEKKMQTSYFLSHRDTTYLNDRDNDGKIFDDYILQFISEIKVAVRNPKFKMSEYEHLTNFIEEVSLKNKKLDFTGTTFIRKCEELTFGQILNLKSMLVFIDDNQWYEKRFTKMPKFTTIILAFISFFFRYRR